MKTILIILIFFMSIVDTIGQTIDTIKVYYLPWNLKTRGALAANDVRNFNNGKNYYLEIVNDSVISEFDKAINIYNFYDISKYTLIDVRMVLDFVLSDRRVFTIEIGASSVVWWSKDKPVKIENTYFEEVPALYRVVEKYIPEKLILKDSSPLEIRTKKGEYTLKEIEEYKEKGLIIIEEE